MIAKKTFSMDVLTDMLMTKLFLLAEYVYTKTSLPGARTMQPQTAEPIPTNDLASPIRFSNEDQMVEGDLFKQVY